LEVVFLVRIIYAHAYMKKTDTVQRFLFEQLPIRGELVQLEKSWQQITEGRDYPDILRDLLGQFTAAAVLLSSTIKFDGSLILQAQTDGPISLLVAESTSKRNIRATAKWRGELNSNELDTLFNGGNLVITINKINEKERYQGIVELIGKKISTVIEHYLDSSEQLPTRIWLAAGSNNASGLLLQKIHGDAGDDIDAWNRIQQLGSTIKEEELLNLNPQKILHRLFHEETIRIFDPERVAFSCSCSRDSVGKTLRMLGAKEINTILEERNTVDVHCEYCNQKYVFDRVDVEQLFASSSPDLGTLTRH
jgi:molecular chaperone Hsp33